MAESDTERLVRLYKEGICPYCARSIPENEGVGSGKTSDGRFCSLECHTRYHEHELIERHKSRMDAMRKDHPDKNDNEE